MYSAVGAAVGSNVHAREHFGEAVLLEGSTKQSLRVLGSNVRAGDASAEAVSLKGSTKQSLRSHTLLLK